MWRCPGGAVRSLNSARSIIRVANAFPAGRRRGVTGGGGAGGGGNTSGSNQAGHSAGAASVSTRHPAAGQ